MSYRLTIIVVALAALILTACGGQTAPYRLADASVLPDFLSDAPPRVREAYQFAVANSHSLETVPCYCGCGAMGHKSNFTCFVNEIAADGKVNFDDHASGCGICVDIAQDVMRLEKDGRSPKEIRAYIDATYSSFGPSTDTPLPTE